MKKRQLYIFLAIFIAMIVALILKPFIGLAVATFFVMWCLKHFVKPIYFTENQIERFFISKNLSVDEHEFEGKLRKLFDEFDKVRERLEESEQRFKALIELPTDAIAILDEKGRLKFFNKNLVKIFPMLKEKSGGFYWEFMRDFELNQFIKRVIESDLKSVNFEISNEIEISGKNYFVKAFKTRQKEIFLLFDDISLQRELSEIKRELIENISHEFKTPLSSIKGYIETIEEEIKNSGRKSKIFREIITYLEPVKRNADRLARIINDLLILSEVEAGVKFEEEKIDFENIIYGILKMYEKTLKDKGLSYEVEISKKLPEFWADAYRIEQLLSNLTDNAIKYTDKGGIKIKVEPSHSNSIKITVEDTGIGIPKEHLPRIFERFYVVDKSRSRQSGGTGLGLSIVKHIVRLYNGEINVESKVGVGTKFEITLPVR